jgi:hypothetical protein
MHCMMRPERDDHDAIGALEGRHDVLGEPRCKDFNSLAVTFAVLIRHIFADTPSQWLFPVQHMHLGLLPVLSDELLGCRAVD